MAGKIFINYRRDDSIGMAGRLHDRLAQTFGRDAGLYCGRNRAARFAGVLATFHVSTVGS